MSFPRYPKYKVSGVEWLGDVPEGWEVKPVRQLAAVVNGFPFDSKLFDAAEGIPLIRIRDLNQVEADTCYKGEFVERAAITSDDVLVGMDGDFNVGRWLGTGRALLNQRMCCIRGKSRLLTRLLEYSLPIPLKAINEVTYATTVKHLASSQIEKTFVALPPTVEEQTAIAEFLDRETGKIDELVAEQRRLMELLKEKRQAVISHAVTKGLNPHAPMKPSGIEWLGDVPEHWEVVPIKWLSPVKRGASPRPIDDPKYFDEEGEYAWVRIADVSACDGILSETTQRLSSLGSSLSVKIMPSELFVSIAGTVGKPCISAIKACIHDGFVYFPTLKIEPWFLFRIFEAGDCYGGLGKWGTQLNLNTDTVGSIRVAVPPSEELIQILEFLNAESAKFDTLTAEAQRAIDLLQERRTALISAAVTGQIDVRETVV
jgi:type I restriction enzyme S subunit